MKLPASDFAHFHVVERREGWIKLEESESPISLASGDLVIVPHGAAHILSDNPRTRPVGLQSLLKQRSPGQSIVQHGGGGSKTTVICGSFRFENEIGNPVVSLLPRIVHVPNAQIKKGVWLEPMLTLLAHEAQTRTEGSGSIISHLTEWIVCFGEECW